MRREVRVHHVASSHGKLVAVARHHHVALGVLGELTWMRRQLGHVVGRTRRVLHHWLRHRPAHHHVGVLSLVKVAHSVVSRYALLREILGILNHVLTWSLHSSEMVSVHHGLAGRLVGRELSVGIVDLVVHAGVHLVMDVVFVSGSEHGALVLILTEVIVERQSHLGGANEVVAVVDAHFLETLGFAVNWLLAVDVDKHFLVLEELSDLGIFDVGQNGVLENLQSLVGAYVNLERFVVLVVQTGGFDSDIQSQEPRLFLLVLSARVLAT
jgi:hypothetical protein